MKTDQKDAQQTQKNLEAVEGRCEEDAQGKTQANHPCSCCRKKATERTDEFQKALQKRLNLAIGQLNGVKRMLDENCYCGDVLTQVAAAQGAVRTIALMLLQDHMETCVAEQIREGNDEVIDEMVQLIKTFSR